MRVKVPAEHREFFLKLLALDTEKRKELLAALRETPATLLLTDLAAEVATRIKGDREAVTGYIAVFSSLYHTRWAYDWTTPEFVEGVCEAGKELVRAKGIPTEVDWKTFAAQLDELLTMHDSLGITTKAFGLSLEHEKVFTDARVITDVRAVFHPDPKERPPAALIVHTLKLCCYKDDKEESHFYALDQEDIRKLQRELDRAIKKESTLTDLIQNASLRCIRKREEE